MVASRCCSGLASRAPHALELQPSAAGGTSPDGDDGEVQGSEAPEAAAGRHPRAWEIELRRLWQTWVAGDNLVNAKHGAACFLLGSTLFLGALLLRVLFVQAVIEDNRVAGAGGDPARVAGFLTNDSPVYIRLAQDPFAGYFGANAGEDALERTPGYPAFCALFYSLDLAPGGILFAQALLGASIPVMVMLLARMLTGSLMLAVTAASLSAISPTGIGLSGLIMSDMLLAVLVLAGMLLFYSGSTGSQSGRIVSSGCVFAGALMVKPIMVLWPMMMLPLYVLLRESARGPARWKAIGMACAVQMLVAGAWCGRNLVYEGIFTLSSVTTYNLHDYLRPRVEEWVKAGGLPTNEAVHRNQDKGLSLAIRETAGLRHGQRMRTLNAKSMDVLGTYPGTTVRVVLQNAKENVLAGWDYFARQLPVRQRLRDSLVAAARVETRFKEGSVLVGALLCCVAVGLATVRPSPATRRLGTRCAVLAIPYLYYALFAGTTFWTGSRIMYPVEFVPVLLITMASKEIWAAGTRAASRREMMHLPPRRGDQ